MVCIVWPPGCANGDATLTNVERFASGAGMCCEVFSIVLVVAGITFCGTFVYYLIFPEKNPKRKPPA